MSTMPEIQDSSLSSVTLDRSMPAADELLPALEQPAIITQSPQQTELRSAEDDAGVDVTIQFVLDYINNQQIEVLFDGTLFLRGRPLQATTPGEVAAVLAVDAPSVSELLDELFF